MDSHSNSEEEIIKFEGMDITAEFQWSVGELIDEFLSALSEKTILGSKCGECGFVHVPPRRRCVDCLTELDKEDLVKVSDKGFIDSYTIAKKELDGKGNFLELEEPKIIASIKLEGTDSKIFMPVEKTEPAELEEGMKVKAVWREERTDEIDDIRFFKPC